MSSITAGGFHEPALLFDETGGGLGSARRDAVVGWTTQQRDRPINVEASQLLPAQPLHGLSGLSPGPDPELTLSDLLGCPTSQAGGLGWWKVSTVKDLVWSWIPVIAGHIRPGRSVSSSLARLPALDCIAFMSQPSTHSYGVGELEHFAEKLARLPLGSREQQGQTVGLKESSVQRQRRHGS
jgi:hypothetical protein